MPKHKAVFLDRDGTIIIDKKYLSDPKGIELLPNVTKALRLLKKNNFKLIITTNQSGIARGYFTITTLNKIHRRLISIFAKKNIKFTAIYFCPHHPSENCQCRKPKIKMALLASKEHEIDLKKSYGIGDKEDDVEFAKNFGGKSVLISKNKNVRTKADYIAKNLYEAAKWIVNDYKCSKKLD